MKVIISNHYQRGSKFVIAKLAAVVGRYVNKDLVRRTIHKRKFIIIKILRIWARNHGH